MEKEVRREKEKLKMEKEEDGWRLSEGKEMRRRRNANLNTGVAFKPKYE